MRFKNEIVLIIFSLSVLLSQAQPGKAPVEKINGKEYYIHTVESGTTLYGLSKMYKVTMDEIKNSNEGLGAVLKSGDKIKIPVSSEGASSHTNTLHQGESIQGDPDYETHVVKKGETVSAVARQYGVSIADIYNLNPGSENGIKENQVLKIKKKITTNTTNSTNITNQTDTSGKTNYLHVVSGGETLYNISKRFQISIDSIQLLNPTAKQGLKTGDTLKLMISKSLTQKLNNAATINANGNSNNSTNGIVSLSDSSMAPSKKAIPETELKAVYNVGLFLPFFLDRNQSMLEKVSTTTDEITYLFEPTRQSLDFYHGVKMALDSLKSAGLSVNLSVYDTWNDTARISSLIKSPEFANLDMIIGPTDHIELVSRAAKQFGIPLVCPFSYTNKILYENPYVAKATTSLSVIIDGVSKYIAEKHSNKKIYILDAKDKKDDAAVAAYKKYLDKEYEAAGKNSETVQTLTMNSSSYKNYLNLLIKKDTVVFVVPSNDIVFVSSLLNDMNNFTNQWNGKDYYFIVFGTDEWIKMEGLDINYREKFNVHVPSPVNVDFDDANTKSGFIKPFRNKYKTDPDRFAMLGFDIAFFFGAGYLEYGKNFMNELEKYNIELVNTRFRFKQVADGSGFLNTSIYILEYENYKLNKRN